jgi:hypothetical protein
MVFVFHLCTLLRTEDLQENQNLKSTGQSATDGQPVTKPVPESEGSRESRSHRAGRGLAEENCTMKETASCSRQNHSSFDDKPPRSLNATKKSDGCSQESR